MRLASDWHSTGEPLSYLGVPVVVSEHVKPDEAVFVADPSGADSIGGIMLNPLDVFALVHDGDPYARLDAALSHLLRLANVRFALLEDSL